MVVEDTEYTDDVESNDPPGPGRSRFAQMLQPAAEELALLTFRVGTAPWPALVPATSTRGWIERTGERFARRCLPLMMASQAGWFLINTQTFRATWDGGDSLESLRLDYLSGEPPHQAFSHFGYGIVTFHIPYLFRTPPGWNLLARGPANWPKDGALALEGLIETDWAMATFTMNWKLTATDRPVLFNAGEPFCMLVPQRRGDLERFRPQVLDLDSDPEVSRGYEAWRDSRDQFLLEFNQLDAGARGLKWQKHYFQGIAPDGTKAPAHQTKLDLREADDPAGWCPRHDRLIGP
jgi:Family of unknown function (DUF6065)